MPKVEKEITITLTPKETEKIIKDHFKKQDDVNIDNVYFNLEVEYSEYGDHGHHVLKDVRCTGKIQ